MVHHNPYRGFLERIEENGRLLDGLKKLAKGGGPLTPDQVKNAYHQAHGTVADLAAILGIDKADNEEVAVDLAGLDVYDQAVETCMAITRFSLDMARLRGPAFLIIPE